MVYKLLLLFLLCPLLRASTVEANLVSNLLPTLTFSSLPNYNQLLQVVDKHLYVLGFDTATDNFALVRTAVGNSFNWDKVSFGVSVEVRAGVLERV